MDLNPGSLIPELSPHLIKSVGQLGEGCDDLSQRQGGAVRCDIPD